MTIAPTLAARLEQAGIQPEIVTHPHTPSASRTAQASHVSGDRVAKAVLLKDETGYLLAVLPASHHLNLEAVGGSHWAFLDHGRRGGDRQDLPRL